MSFGEDFGDDDDDILEVRSNDDRSLIDDEPHDDPEENQDVLFEDELTKSFFDIMLDANFKIHVSEDLKKLAQYLPRWQAELLIKSYYDIQAVRLPLGNRLEAAKENHTPHALSGWLFGQVTGIEQGLKKLMGHFASEYRVGKWLQQIFGIGPVLSAGLMTFFDIRRAPYAGSYWRIAGLDPTTKWLGKARAKTIINSVRPTGKISMEDLINVSARTNVPVRIYLKMIQNNPKYKDELKACPDSFPRACVEGVIARPIYDPWLKMFVLGRLGSTIKQHKAKPGDDYGRYYNEVKARLIRQNMEGQLADRAAKHLEEGFYTSPSAIKAYKQGQLPAQQLERQAIRYMVKLILSHLHEVMYEDYYDKDCPKPFIFEHATGHNDYVPPVRWEELRNGPGKSLRDLYALGEAPPKIIRTKEEKEALKNQKKQERQERLAANKAKKEQERIAIEQRKAERQKVAAAKAEEKERRKAEREAKKNNT